MAAGGCWLSIGESFREMYQGKNHCSMETTSQILGSMAASPAVLQNQLWNKLWAALPAHYSPRSSGFWYLGKFFLLSHFLSAPPTLPPRDQRAVFFHLSQYLTMKQLGMIRASEIRPALEAFSLSSPAGFRLSLAAAHMAGLKNICLLEDIHSSQTKTTEHTVMMLRIYCGGTQSLGLTNHANNFGSSPVTSLGLGD